MIRKFLTAKHWQIFLVALGLPLLLQFFILNLSFFLSEATTSFRSSKSFLFLASSQFFLLFYLFVLWGWLWSVAIGLQKKLPILLQTKRVKFIIPFLAMIFLVSLLLIFTSLDPSGEGIFTYKQYLTRLWVFLPLTLWIMAAVIGVIYCPFYVARTISKVKHQQEVLPRHFIIFFFLIQLFPLGIWVLQPIINQLVTDKLK